MISLVAYEVTRVGNDTGTCTCCGDDDVQLRPFGPNNEEICAECALHEGHEAFQARVHEYVFGMITGTIKDHRYTITRVPTKDIDLTSKTLCELDLSSVIGSNSSGPLIVGAIPVEIDQETKPDDKTLPHMRSTNKYGKD